MTRAHTHVRDHIRSLPPRLSPVVVDKSLEMVIAMKAERAAKDAQTIDHMTVMLNRCVETEVAAFGEDD